MIHVLVKIDVKNFTALESFEREAAKIMRDHQGKFITAFETTRNTDNSGVEIHLLEFQSTDYFDQYRNDARHQALKALRAQAITAVDVTISTQLKYYAIKLIADN